MISHNRQTASPKGVFLLFLINKVSFFYVLRIFFLLSWI